MNGRTILIAGAIALLGCLAGAVAFLNREAARQAAQLSASQTETSKRDSQPTSRAEAEPVEPSRVPASPALVATEPEVAQSEPDPLIVPIASPEMDSASFPRDSMRSDESRPALVQPAATPALPPVSEKEARIALRGVGSNPEAEAVWIRAINDPSLSKSARSNLIEDLNEDGFPDRRNITRNDLPLILRRIALIERLAPFAMDETNAAAFKEAHKDLMNMVTRLSRE